MATDRDHRAVARSYRITPTAGIALLVVVLYGAVLISMQKLSGVHYDAIAKTAHNLLTGVLVPVAIGSCLLTAFAVWSGWWSDVWRDRNRIVGHRWFWLFPLVMAAQIGLNLTQSKFHTLGATFLIYAAVATILVGYSEELLTRGLLVRGLRGSRVSDIGVLLVSSLVFGLLHGMNVLNGQSAKTTIVQVVFAMVFGASLYITLRKSGLLVICMALHAAWDFALITQGSLNATVSANHVSSALLLAVLLNYVVVVALIVAIPRLRTPRASPAPATARSAPSA